MKPYNPHPLSSKVPRLQDAPDHRNPLASQHLPARKFVWFTSLGSFTTLEPRAVR